MSTVVSVLDRNLLNEEMWGELARQGSISPERLEQIRSSEKEPSLFELGQIADVVNIEPVYLIRESPGVVARRESGEDRADLTTLLERFDAHVSAFRREIGEQSSREFIGARSRQGAEQSGGGWAKRNDLIWDLAQPDLLAEIIEERYRIPVLVWPVPNAPFGATLKLGDAFAIWVNSFDVPGTQQRFTLAHELGHIFLKHVQTHRVEMASSPDAVTSVGAPDRRSQEVYANAFAAGLLAGYDAVSPVWDRDLSAASIADVAARLGVSYQVAINALDRHMSRQVEGSFKSFANEYVTAAMRAAGHTDFHDWSEGRRDHRRVPTIPDDPTLPNWADVEMPSIRSLLERSLNSIGR